MLDNLAGGQRRSDSQDDFAQDVSIGDALMRLSGVAQGEFGGDRNAQFGRFDGMGQMIELANVRDGVVSGDTDAVVFPGLGFNAVRVSQAASRFDRSDTFLQRAASRQGKNGINAVGSERADRFREVAEARVHYGISAETANQREAVRAGRGRKHARATQLGELNRKRADAAGSTENDDQIVAAHRERVIHALKRGKAGGRNRTGFAQVETARSRRDFLPIHTSVPGVETAFGIQKAERIDRIADTEAANMRAGRGDMACSIGAEHQWKFRMSAGEPAGANIGIPGSDSRGIDRDQDFFAP